MDMTSADLLTFGDEELATTFADIMKTSREEYRVKRADIPLVVGTTRYRLPRRAMARTVRAVSYVDASGSECPAQELPPLEAWRYEVAQHSNARTFYVFEGDELVLTSAPTSAGSSLRVRYVNRFPRLVLTSACAPIVLAGSTTTITLQTSPPAAVTTAGTLIDIIRGRSPFDASYEDLIIDSFYAPGPIITLASSTPVDTAEISDVAYVGSDADYVCSRDTTCFPPLPQELHGVLALAIVRRVLEALGDPRVTIAEATLRRHLDRAVNVSEPRNQDRKPRIIDHGGRLRGARRMWR